MYNGYRVINITLKEGEEEKSTLFHAIEKEEFEHDWKNVEHVLVEGFINFEVRNNFPQLLSNATQNNKRFAFTLYEKLFNEKKNCQSWK